MTVSYGFVAVVLLLFVHRPCCAALVASQRSRWSVDRGTLSADGCQSARRRHDGLVSVSVGISASGGGRLNPSWRLSDITSMDALFSIRFIASNIFVLTDGPASNIVASAILAASNKPDTVVGFCCNT